MPSTTDDSDASGRSASRSQGNYRSVSPSPSESRLARKKRKRKQQKYERRHKARKHVSDATRRYGRRLLRYAQAGSYKSAKKALKKGADVNYADGASLDTPLHEAARQGHVKTVQLLLRNGADGRRVNRRLATPAHLAAGAGHLGVLALLLAAGAGNGGGGGGAPDLDAEDEDGATVYHLAAEAVQRAELLAEQVARRASDGPHAASQRLPSRRDSEWAERLVEEWSGGEDPFGGAGGGAGWGDEEPRAAGGGFSDDEDGDWADRIRLQMEARRSAASRHTFLRAAVSREEAARRRTEAASQAYRHSQRILKEELERDRAWREAVAKGDAGGRRAAYQTRWVALLASPLGRTLKYTDVPWITAAADLSDLEPLRRMVLHGADLKDRTACRKRLREELLRWHPDKFQSRFGSRLDPADKERVMGQVTATSQALNALSQQLMAE